MSGFDLKEEVLAKLAEIGRLDPVMDEAKVSNALENMRETLMVLLHNHVKSNDTYCDSCTGEEVVRWPCWYVRTIAGDLDIVDEWWKRETQR